MQCAVSCQWCEESADSCSDEDSVRMARFVHQEWSGRDICRLYTHLCVCIRYLVRLQQCSTKMQLWRLRSDLDVQEFDADVVIDGLWWIEMAVSTCILLKVKSSLKTLELEFDDLIIFESAWHRRIVWGVEVV